MAKFPFYQQLDAMDCGPTCLRMIAKHYGKHYSLETLRQKCFIGREGVSLLGISTAAEGIGFRTIGVHISFQQLCEAPLPCIVLVRANDYSPLPPSHTGFSPKIPPSNGLIITLKTRNYLILIKK